MSDTIFSFCLIYYPFTHKRTFGTNHLNDGQHQLPKYSMLFDKKCFTQSCKLLYRGTDSRRCRQHTPVLSACALPSQTDSEPCSTPLHCSVVSRSWTVWDVMCHGPPPAPRSCSRPTASMHWCRTSTWAASASPQNGTIPFIWGEGKCAVPHEECRWGAHLPSLGHDPVGG